MLATTADFGRRSIERVVGRIELEDFVPEAEVHAEVGEHAPGDQRRGREDRLGIGSEDGGQEDGEETGDADHDAVEQRPVAQLLFQQQRLPQRHLREALGGDLDNVGDRLARIDGDLEDVGAVVGYALRHEADRRRHSDDTGRIEVRQHDAGADQRVPIGHQPALDRPLCRVAQRKHHPIGVGAGSDRLYLHAAGNTVECRRRLDQQLVAAPFVVIAVIDEVDAVAAGLELDHVERAGRRQHRQHRRDECHEGANSRCQRDRSTPGQQSLRCQRVGQCAPGSLHPGSMPRHGPSRPRIRHASRLAPMASPAEGVTRRIVRQ